MATDAQWAQIQQLREAKMMVWHHEDNLFCNYVVHVSLMFALCLVSIVSRLFHVLFVHHVCCECVFCCFTCVPSQELVEQFRQIRSLAENTDQLELLRAS